MRRLRLQAIPRASNGINLYNVLPKAEWQKIRQQAIEKAGYKCDACGSTGILQVHEDWIFDHNHGIQKLAKLRVLCRMCHKTIHVGGHMRLYDMSDGGLIAAHYCKVNGCNWGDFERDRRKLWRDWSKLDWRNWLFDFGEYNNIVKEAMGAMKKEAINAPIILTLFKFK